MGSGKLIRRAIKKYGVENFTKEILCMCVTEEEMNRKEKELVVLSEKSYNLCPGGKGGFGYINKASSLKEARRRNQKAGYAAARESMVDSVKNKKAGLKSREKKAGIHSGRVPNGWKGRNHSCSTKEKMSKSAHGRLPWNYGKEHTQETKNKIQ